MNGSMEALNVSSEDLLGCPPLAADIVLGQPSQVVQTEAAAPANGPTHSLSNSVRRGVEVLACALRLWPDRHSRGLQHSIQDVMGHH